MIFMVAFTAKAIISETKWHLSQDVVERREEPLHSAKFGKGESNGGVACNGR